MDAMLSIWMNIKNDDVYKLDLFKAFTSVKFSLFFNVSPLRKLIEKVRGHI